MDDEEIVLPVGSGGAGRRKCVARKLLYCAGGKSSDDSPWRWSESADFRKDRHSTLGDVTKGTGASDQASGHTPSEAGLGSAL